MDNEKAWELFDFALQCEKWSRKPHRKAPNSKVLATDLAKIVRLSDRRRTIALRYESNTEQPGDFEREERIIGKLQDIGTRYGWKYFSENCGLSAYYTVDCKADVSISIPQWES